jgi:hypothetical protein
MHFDHAVYNKLEEGREQGINDARLLYKLNLDRKVAALAPLSLVAVPAMVFAKAGFRPQNRCTGYTAREQQSEDLLVDEAPCGARILVQVDNDFLRRAGLQHFANLCRDRAPIQSRADEN